MNMLCVRSALLCSALPSLELIGLRPDQALMVYQKRKTQLSRTRVPYRGSTLLKIHARLNLTNTERVKAMDFKKCMQQIHHGELLHSRSSSA